MLTISEMAAIMRQGAYRMEKQLRDQLFEAWLKRAYEFLEKEKANGERKA